MNMTAHLLPVLWGERLINYRTRSFRGGGAFKLRSLVRLLNLTRNPKLFKCSFSGAPTKEKQIKAVKMKTLANVDVKYLRSCLPWICVPSVDVIRFRLQAFANRDHYLHSGRAGRSAIKRRDDKLSYSDGTVKSSTHRVGGQRKVEHGTVELQQIKQLVGLQRP